MWVTCVPLVCVCLFSQSLVQSGLSADALSAVEVVGSSTRVPALVRLIESVYGKAPSRTMNAKECVCRGAALQCAMLSPTFKVRDDVLILKGLFLELNVTCGSRTLRAQSSTAGPGGVYLRHHGSRVQCRDE